MNSLSLLFCINFQQINHELSGHALQPIMRPLSSEVIKTLVLPQFYHKGRWTSCTFISETKTLPNQQTENPQHAKNLRAVPGRLSWLSFKRVWVGLESPCVHKKCWLFVIKVHLNNLQWAECENTLYDFETNICRPFSTVEQVGLMSVGFPKPCISKWKKKRQSDRKQREKRKSASYRHQEAKG